MGGWALSENEEIFDASMHEYNTQAQSAGVVPSAEQVETVETDKWTKAAGGYRKGRLYGTGVVAPCFKRSSSSSSSYRSTGWTHDEQRQMDQVLNENRELRQKVDMMQSQHDIMRSQQEVFTQSMTEKFNAMIANVANLVRPQYQVQPQYQYPTQQQSQQMPTAPINIPYVIPSQPQHLHGLTLNQQLSGLHSTGVPQHAIPMYYFGPPQSGGSQSPSQLVRPLLSPSDIVGTPSHSTPSGSGSRSYRENSLSTPERDAAAAAAAMGSDFDFLAMMSSPYRPRMPPPDQ